MTEQARATAQPASEPLPTASDGDLAEQHTVVAPPQDAEDDDAGDLESLRLPLEADPADAFEQQQAVPEPDDEDR